MDKGTASAVERYLAELYDTDGATETDDVDYLRGLLAGREPLRILEPFCGTGRVLVPLAQDGHELVGMDNSEAMLERAATKIAHLPPEAQARVTLLQADVTHEPWPESFDLVLLLCNCFLELATPEEQEGCLASAARALRPGGYIFVDHDSMEGELSPGWRKPGLHGGRPLTCADGTLILFFGETIWYDAPQRLHRSHRYTYALFPDGRAHLLDIIRQKHPVSAQETQSWLPKYGFLIERITNGARDVPWKPGDGRVTFWARKRAEI